jgi:hypothetical protein
LSLPTAPLTPVITSAEPATPIFRHTIKINIFTYPNLKLETEWRALYCQLRSKSAIHDTIDALTPNLVHPTHAANCILSSKGKHVCT